MKRCVVCKQERDISDFNRNRSKKDGFQIHCRDCGRARARIRYASNTKEHIARCNQINKQRVRENQERLVQYLADKECIDCANSNPIVLDFDHVRGEKQGNVTALVLAGCAWTTVLEEIKKCAIRCANCHRIKTAKEFNHYRHRLCSS